MFAATLAIQNRAWAGIALGEPRPEMFERYLRLATRLGNADGAGYAFDGLIAIAVLHGDPERAGVLAGAAAAVRQLTGTQGQPTIETYQPFVASVLAVRRRADLRGGSSPRQRHDGAGGDGVRARGRSRARRRHARGIIE